MWMRSSCVVIMSYDPNDPMNANPTDGQQAQAIETKRPRLVDYGRVSRQNACDSLRTCSHASAYTQYTKNVHGATSIDSKDATNESGLSLITRVSSFSGLVTAYTGPHV